MSEDHEILLSRIGQLAGQINRHKNQSERPTPTVYQSGFKYNAPYQTSRGRGNPYWQSSSRGGYSIRGGRGRGRGTVPVAHHHKTLVLNNNKSTTKDTSTAVLAASINAPELSTLPTVSEPSLARPVAADKPVTDSARWVAKRDRHMQLINSSVYNQQVQSRVKAIAKSQEERVQHRENREKLKFTRFLMNSQNPTSQEVMVGGERFRVVAGGSKLVRLTGDSDVTPKRPIIGGVQFQRSRNGNLWRAGLVRASRKLKMPRAKSKEPCKYFSNTGQCKHGLSCPYVHNPDKVAICPRFLASDSCPDGKMCDLSHEPTSHRVPACHHFLRGNCSNSECRYAHVRVNPAAPVCRPFATLGYCPKGSDCISRHVHECPEFDQTGECTEKKCKLPHIERAGRRRAAAAAAAATLNVENAQRIDVSDEDLDQDPNLNNDDDDDDDDDQSLNSEDVDSDYLSDVDLVRNDEKDEDSLMEDFIKF